MPPNGHLNIQLSEAVFGFGTRPKFQSANSWIRIAPADAERQKEWLIAKGLWELTQGNVFSPYPQKNGPTELPSLWM